MMDFLDPKQRRAHNIRLLVGYVLVGIALLLTVRLLIYQTNGLGVRDGKVIQNGFVFISSNPSPATVDLTGQSNGQKYIGNTNTRVTAQSGTYILRLTRIGYRDWQRAVTIQGNSVDHFDYPLLVPKTLATAKVVSYAAAPPLSTQSPDRRWALIQQTGQQPAQQPAAASVLFDVYDLKDPKQIAALKTTITVPADVFDIKQEATQDTAPNATANITGLELVEWSNDNDHVLLRHTVKTQAGDRAEYILVSRKTPDKTVNLTKQLQLTATATVTLQDKKADNYFILDSANGGILSTVSFDGTKAANPVTPVPVLSGVLAFKSYGSDSILYATATGATDTDKVTIKMLENGKSYTIRQVAKSSKYLLELSRYSNHWYTVVGVTSENRVYVYKDPVEALQRDPSLTLVPMDVMKINAPNYAAFSDNSQFVAVENGQDFSVYDAENDHSHTYHVDKPLDPPQVHATWMDGYRFRMVSGGVMTIFDYDGTNVQSLQPALPGYLPFFDTSYRVSYVFDTPKAANANPNQVEFSATPLRTAADQ